MTNKLIFKMEMFKFKNDRKYLLIAAILGILNTMITILMLNMDNLGLYNQSLFLSLVMFMVILVFCNSIFMIFYPFHVLSMDYKNNVIATMIASGVNRTKLFVSKIGAVILNTLILAAITSLVPLTLLIVKLVSLEGFSEVFDIFLSTFWAFGDISLVGILLVGVTSYLVTLLAIATASIILKGKNISFLLYIGISMLISIASGVLDGIPTSLGVEMGLGLNIFQVFRNVLIGMLLVYIGLRTMKRQNL